MTNPHELIGAILTRSVNLASAQRKRDARAKMDSTWPKHVLEQREKDLADAQRELDAAQQAVIEAATAYGAACVDELDAAYENGHEEGQREAEPSPPDWKYDLD